MGMTMNLIQKIGFGGASLSAKGGGYGFGDVIDPINLIHFAFDVGIKCYDTAPIYGFGQSEITLGKGVKNFREKISIVSKSGVSWHTNGRVNMTNDPEVTKEMLEDSLRRLNTDYIDTYMVHWPDKKVDIRYPIEVIAQAKIEGKVKNIGLCNTFLEDIKKAEEICQIDVIQQEVNLFKNEYSQIEPLEKKQKMGWGTFDKGILAGSVKLNRKYDKEDARSWAPWWKKSGWQEKIKFVEKYGEDLFRYALGYSLLNVDIALCGAKSITQFEKIFSTLKDLPNENEIKKVKDEFESFSNSHYPHL